MCVCDCDRPKERTDWAVVLDEEGWTSAASLCPLNGKREREQMHTRAHTQARRHRWENSWLTFYTGSLMEAEQKAEECSVQGTVSFVLEMGHVACLVSRSAWRLCSLQWTARRPHVPSLTARTQRESITTKQIFFDDNHLRYLLSCTKWWGKPIHVLK